MSREYKTGFETMQIQVHTLVIELRAIEMFSYSWNLVVCTNLRNLYYERRLMLVTILRNLVILSYNETRSFTLSN